MPRIMTAYFDVLLEAVEKYGGFFNAHLHLDRSGTYFETLELLKTESAASSHFSLPFKHSLISQVHNSSLYDVQALRDRTAIFIEKLIQTGTTRADTVVDVTDDGLGLRALEVFLELKSTYRSVIDFRVGAYSPLGFRDDEPNRWRLFEEGAMASDFIGALPERDDHARYPLHIGFEESCNRSISLALSLSKPLHIHVDQQNSIYENGSERVVQILEKRENQKITSDPLIWLVHFISPTTYPEQRFTTLLSKLKLLNIGVICCPSAALSMRQLRSLPTPTANSIARVLEILSEGIQLRIGSDNICDVTSPTGTIDLLDELYCLSNAIRYYDIDTLAKLAAGKKLEDRNIKNLKRHLDKDREEVADAISKLNDIT